jgi:hypothetical protein
MLLIKPLYESLVLDLCTKNRNVSRSCSVVTVSVTRERKIIFLLRRRIFYFSFLGSESPPAFFNTDLFREHVLNISLWGRFSTCSPIGRLCQGSLGEEVRYRGGCVSLQDHNIRKEGNLETVGDDVGGTWGCVLRRVLFSGEISSVSD